MSTDMEKKNSVQSTSKQHTYKKQYCQPTNITQTKSCLFFCQGGAVNPTERTTALQHRADIAEFLSYERTRHRVSQTPKLLRDLVHMGETSD